jgi:hypothetical protein
MIASIGTTREILKRTLRLEHVAGPIMRELQTIDPNELERKCFILTTYQVPVNTYSTGMVRDLLLLPKEKFLTNYTELKRVGYLPEEIKNHPEWMCNPMLAEKYQQHIANKTTQ